MSSVKKIVILNGIGSNLQNKAILKLEVFIDRILAHVEIPCAFKLNCKNFTLNIGVNDKILSVCVSKKAIFESEFIGAFSFLSDVSALILGDDSPLFYGEVGSPRFKSNDLLVKTFEPEVKKSEENLESFAYDDEMIATENYYEKSKNENLLFTQNDGELASAKNQEKVDETETFTIKNEEIKRSYKSQEFYDKNKQKLDEIFSTYEPFYTLNAVIPNSQFVQINYSEKDHYVVGLIRENGLVKYVCYGVPKRGENPPNSVEKYCKFVPTSIDFKSGYYLIFQSADSGELI